MEHCLVRNLQHETSQTTFDTFNQSQHLLHTWRKALFVKKVPSFISLVILVNSWYIMHYYFKKGKNATEMQKKICAVYGEGAVTD